MDIPVFDADAEVRNILAVDKTVIKRIKEVFPSCVENEKIDRACLKVEAFENQKIHILERIIHPSVYLKCEKFLEDHRKNRNKIVALDIPLLFETKKEGLCDYVIVTWGGYKQQERASQREGMNQFLVEKIQENQMSDDLKKEKADFIIRTFGSMEETYEQLMAILQKISASIK
jgi:dephospho-CoA kinase